MSDEDRISAIAAELRAAELVAALRHAVAGASHWRWEAQLLLSRIDNGELPESYQPTQDAA